MNSSGVQNQIGRGRYIPDANPTVDIDFDMSIDYASGVIVRCRACAHRLFDIKGAQYELQLDPEYVSEYGKYYEDYPPTEYGSCYQIERQCRCKRVNTHLVTMKPGEPLGNSGRWDCENTECGRFMGHINAVRGSIDLTCRCDQRHRVKIPNLVDVLESILWPTVSEEAD